MGVKGDRASKEPIARQMYLSGATLAEIARQIDVSVNTLSTWKGDTKPADGPDEWDRARMQKRGNIQRLRDLFERQLEYTENLNPAEISAPLMDTLSKLGALIERWDRAETVVKKLENLEKTAAKEPDGKISVETLRKVRQEVYGVAA